MNPPPPHRRPCDTGGCRGYTATTDPADVAGSPARAAQSWRRAGWTLPSRQLIRRRRRAPTRPRSRWRPTPPHATDYASPHTQRCVGPVAARGHARSSGAACSKCARLALGVGSYRPPFPFAQKRFKCEQDERNRKRPLEPQHRLLLHRVLRLLRLQLPELLAVEELKP